MIIEYHHIIFGATCVNVWFLNLRVGWNGSHVLVNFWKVIHQRISFMFSWILSSNLLLKLFLKSYEIYIAFEDNCDWVEFWEKCFCQILTSWFCSHLCCCCKNLKSYVTKWKLAAMTMLFFPLTTMMITTTTVTMTMIFILTLMRLTVTMILMITATTITITTTITMTTTFGQWHQW